MTRKQNAEHGDCEDCGAKGVTVFTIETARNTMQYCAMCNERNKASRSLGAAVIEKLREPNAPLNVIMTEDLDTTPFADKNDMLIYSSGVVFYGQIYAHLSDADKKANLTRDAQHMIHLHRDAIRQAQVFKLREQAIRENIRRIEKNQKESDRTEQKKEDKKFEQALSDFDAMTAVEPIRKQRALSPQAKKLVKLGLKDALLAGKFSDEAIAAHRAAKAAKDAAAKKAEEEKK